MTHPYEAALLQALSAIERARALHQRNEWDRYCETCSRGEMVFVDWPCPTLRALDGEIVNDQ